MAKTHLIAITDHVGMSAAEPVPPVASVMSVAPVNGISRCVRAGRPSLRASTARWALASAVLSAVAAPVQALSPREALDNFATQAGSRPSAERGRQFFVSTHGQDWSCSSCHGERPTGDGRHAGTGKPIQPLAPAFNAQRFTDAAKVEKWFRRNCKDVLARECTPAEKADVLAWLVSIGR